MLYHIGTYNKMSTEALKAMNNTQAQSPTATPRGTDTAHIRSRRPTAENWQMRAAFKPQTADLVSDWLIDIHSNIIFTRVNKIHAWNDHLHTSHDTQEERVFVMFRIARVILIFTW